jgi:ParB family transcriptional regulator, chromosome partitioning protein
MKLSKAEIDAIIAASPRTTVPFSKLVLSASYQARPRDSKSRLSIAELAASIKEGGVLQNLVVVKGANGMHEVCAGGRRLAALTLLAQNADIAENHPVPVLIVPADQALLASLAENVFHEPMHPADEYIAFAKLSAQGKSVEDVAAAFGVTPLVVKRRMKLASVAPRLMAQFRADQIGLDCLMALASVDDHAKQEQVWANLPSWNRRPECLRQMLAQGEIESDRDPVARYVSLAAYEKAGGALRRDLFCDDDKKAYLLDAALLDRLASEKLERKAKQIAAQGWKWVDVRPRYSFDEFASYGELRKSRREPSEDEAATIERIESRIAELHPQMEALVDQGGDDEQDDQVFLQLEADEEALQTQLKALQESLCDWPAELMAQAGCVLFVGSKGTAEVRFGLIRPEDRTSMAEAARQAQPTDGPNDALVSLPSGKGRPVHSDKLMRRLTAHRVAAVQAELIQRPDVALASITAHLAVRLIRDGFRCHRGGDDALTLSVSDTHDGLRRETEDMADSAAWKAMETERVHLVSLLPEAGPTLFPWMMKQDQTTVLRLLSFLVASSVTGVCGIERETQTTDALAEALHLDMSKWWKATAASYFEHVSKARVLEVVAEAAGANAAGPLASLKKDAAVAGAEQTLTGLGWLPPMLRTGAAGPPSASAIGGKMADTTNLEHDFAAAA